MLLTRFLKSAIMFLPNYSHKNTKLTDDQILTISSLLDDIYPRGVFRELNLELRKMISKG